MTATIGRWRVEVRGRVLTVADRREVVRVEAYATSERAAAEYTAIVDALTKQVSL